MRKPVTTVLMLLVLFMTPSVLWARGGGGCLEQGTSIRTPTGYANIENLRPGDKVQALVGDHLEIAEVQSREEVQPEEFVEIILASRKLNLHVTTEHPIQTERGVFRTAVELKNGESVQVWSKGSLRPFTIQSTARIKAIRPAYNLLVSPGGTFVANSVVVHNKGCFLPDTPILRADGTTASIQDIRAGDSLLAFKADGQIVTGRVLNVVTRDVDTYAEVKTEKIALRVTMEHPFYVGGGTFKTLEALKVGDSIFAFDGKGLSAQSITGIEEIRQRTRVFNLRTDAPNTYFANGIAVHNKGGGGGGGGFGGGGFRGSGGGFTSRNAPSWFPMVFYAVLILLVIYSIKHDQRDEDLDYTYGPSAIAPKEQKTEKLLEFIAKVDPACTPGTLRELAERTFIKLQRCWQLRNCDDMKPVMMADLYEEHCAELRGLVRNHEINVITNLHVEKVHLVNVRYTHKENDRVFTALITATARDYYIDDRTQEVLRGDDEPARFQEFWTFQRQDGQWLLREIEQTRESDALKDENFFEQFTDTGLKQVYADTASEGGPTGPWLEKSTETKATRTERLLNFLVQTDKLWDRQSMLERTRKVFTRVHLSREAGELTEVTTNDLFPDVAASLQQTIRTNRERSVSIEYRNFCVRKVELILVRNFSDNSQDEFVTRISAHAQKIVTEQGQIISQDEYVSPFMEYWTFGRLDGAWKLKEVLPPARGEGLIGQENLDQDSSKPQLEWFYKQTRAV